MTNQTITIPVDFAIAANRKGAGGNLIPFITTKDGKDVLSLSDYQLVDIFSSQPTEYEMILANQEVTFDVNFYFPQVIVASESADGYNLATPYPGYYWIKVVYAEFGDADDIWRGNIGSNRIKVCILD